MNPAKPCCCLCFGFVLLAQCVSNLAAAEPKQEWQSLFDGKTLDGWKSTKFGGEGEVEVKDGNLMLGFGNNLTGVTYTKEPPKMNYEISLEAQRVDGSDFFCGLTFPVGDKPCSFICGGWGGGVVGISSLDGMDASENSASKYFDFDKGKWYRIRVRVTQDRLQAWIGDKQMVDEVTTGRKISIRLEVDLSKPLGIASYATTAALRDIKMRKLSEEEIKAAAANAE